MSAIWELGENEKKDGAGGHIKNVPREPKDRRQSISPAVVQILEQILQTIGIYGDDDLEEAKFGGPKEPEWKHFEDETVENIHPRAGEEIDHGLPPRKPMINCGFGNTKQPGIAATTPTAAVVKA